MVNHIEEAQQDAEELAVKVRELLVLAVMTQNEIALNLKVSRRFVQKIAREVNGVGATQSLADPQTSNALEDQFVRKCQATLKQIHPKTDTAAELKNKAQAAGVLFDKARLAADKSTSNVSHRTLASMVSRRAPKAVEGKKVKAVPVVEDKAVVAEGGIREPESVVEPLV